MEITDLNSSSLKNKQTNNNNNNNKTVLAGVAQWIERRPANQNITGLNPSQGTCLGCEPGSWLGMCERQPIDVTNVSLTCQCFSLSFSLSAPLSKIK